MCASKSDSAFAARAFSSLLATFSRMRIARDNCSRSSVVIFLPSIRTSFWFPRGSCVTRGTTSSPSAHALGLVTDHLGRDTVGALADRFHLPLRLGVHG